MITIFIVSLLLLLLLLLLLFLLFLSKNPSKKRDTSSAELPDTEVNCRKIRRLDAEEYSTD